MMDEIVGLLAEQNLCIHAFTSPDTLGLLRPCGCMNAVVDGLGNVLQDQTAASRLRGRDRSGARADTQTCYEQLDRLLDQLASCQFVTR